MQLTLNTLAAAMQNTEKSTPIGPWIGKTAKMLFIFLSNRLVQRGVDLTAKQWILLDILHRGDGRPQNELALITERNKGTLVRLINTMEKQSMVKRVIDTSDKRVNRIYLTRIGKKKYARALPIINETYAELQQGLSASEIDQLIGTLSKVRDNIRKHSHQQ